MKIYDEVFRKLGLKNIVLKINNRKILEGLYNTLLANFYRSEANYRNTVLGNISKNKFQFDQQQTALTTQYDAQSTYTVAPDFLYTAGASALSFAKDYYDYKAKRNANNVNKDYYEYEYGDDD